MRNARTMEDVVRNVPEPAFTKSWHPISHAKLLDAMESSVELLGAAPISKSYTLSEDGLDMFGTWTLDIEYKDNYLNIGFRNSMKKHFAVGFCAGRFVIVCSNLQFSGEFIEFRRHTSGLDMDELRQLSMKSLNKVRTQMTEFADWHESLKQVALTTSEFKQLTFDAMTRGVFPPSKFQSFRDNYNVEVMHYGQNLFSFYGGVTRLLRDGSLFIIQQSTKALNGLMDDAQTDGWRN